MFEAPESDDLLCQFYHFNVSITSLKYALINYKESPSNVFSSGLTCCNVLPSVMEEDDFQKLTCSSTQLAAESYNLMQELKSSNVSVSSNTAAYHVSVCMFVST